MATPVPNADFTGIRKRLYQDITTLLKTIKTGTPAKQVFLHFDIWNRQTDNLESEFSFKQPAVFIEFLPIQWQALTRGLRQADAVIRLHIVCNSKFRTANGSDNVDKALLYLGYPDLVWQAMRYFKQPYAGRPENTLSETDHEHTDIIDLVEEFTIRVADATAVRVPATVTNVNPEIEAHFS